MRLLTMMCIFVSVGLAAFSLAISGLGEIGNFIVFSAASGGLLLLTVNLTSAKRAAASGTEEDEGSTTVLSPNE